MESGSESQQDETLGELSGNSHPLDVMSPPVHSSARRMLRFTTGQGLRRKIQAIEHRQSLLNKKILFIIYICIDNNERVVNSILIFQRGRLKWVTADQDGGCGTENPGDFFPSTVVSFEFRYSGGRQLRSNTFHV
jgi:hypothetical protein